MVKPLFVKDMVENNNSVRKICLFCYHAVMEEMFTLGLQKHGKHQMKHFMENHYSFIHGRHI